MEVGIEIFFCCIAAVIIGYDIKEHKIPNRWLAAGVTAAFTIQFLNGGISGCIRAVASMLVLFVLLYPVYGLGMIGAGDVKYLCMFSVLLTWKQAIYMLFYACVLGGIWSLARMIRNKSIIKRFKYLKNYVMDMVDQKSVKKYFSPEQGYADTIAFALPIGLSYILHLGGMY